MSRIVKASDASKQTAWMPYESALKRVAKFTMVGTLATVEEGQRGGDDRLPWFFRFR